MRRRAVLWGMAGVLLAGAAAAAAPGRWYSLARRLLPRHYLSVALEPPRDAPPPRAVRLMPSGGDLHLLSVTLRYGDGGRERHMIGRTLRRGQATAAYAVAPGRKLVAVRVEFGRHAGRRYLQLQGTDGPAP